VLKEIRNTLVEWLGTFLIRVICATLRFKVDDASGIVSKPDSPEPVIFAFWHNRMFLMPWACRKLFPNRKVICLASASHDGEMIARVLGRFRLGTVRGSSSRRGQEALRELTENLKEGFDVAITPDGPRGPCYIAQIGVVGLAAISGCPLIPLSFVAPWKIHLKSWDRFTIPLPFSVCILRFGKPMYIPASSNEAALEKARCDLEQRLNELGNDQEIEIAVSPSATTKG
jgi:lysophospholipid acyltransferase (LPLAT)-like uncharacterized protein